MTDLTPSSGDPEIPRLIANRNERQKGQSLVKWGRRGIMLFLLLAVIFLLTVVYQNRNLPNLLDAQRQQFVNCKDAPAHTKGCEKPVVSKEDIKDSKDAITTVPGLPGKQGPIGLTGPQGPPPSFADVLRATRQQIPLALRRNCGGSCAGQDGQDGKDSEVAGPPGEASTVPGPQGEKGDKGDKGDTGAEGRGIASMSCTGGMTPVTYTVTYTDGTSQTFTCGEMQPVEQSPSGE